MANKNDLAECPANDRIRKATHAVKNALKAKPRLFARHYSPTLGRMTATVDAINSPAGIAHVL